jgi:hypothetical protein
MGAAVQNRDWLGQSAIRQGEHDDYIKESGHFDGGIHYGSAQWPVSVWKRAIHARRSIGVVSLRPRRDPH